MKKQNVKQTLLRGEHLTLECKKAKSELPKSVWKTYSAFANTVGGTILLGVWVRIEKHDDRLCLRNPGTLLLPVEEIYEGGHSKSRNPRMQKMFRLIGYGENIGSGFPKILHAWKQVGWKEPMLEN